MGIFHYPIEIAASREGPFRKVDAMVDTGSLYSWVPGSLLRDIGLSPTDKIDFYMANGKTIKRDAVEAAMRLDGRIRHTICVFAEGTDQILLGAVTLEQFALAADPVNKRLVPMPAVPAACADIE